MLATLWSIAGCMWIHAAKGYYDAGATKTAGMLSIIALLNFFVAYLYF